MPHAAESQELNAFRESLAAQKAKNRGVMIATHIEGLTKEDLGKYMKRHPDYFDQSGECKYKSK
jgi:hypothetical protein